jgi:DUF1365 family protein
VESCLYEGLVHHRRFGAVEHAFAFPLFMLYLDLDELPRVFQGRWLWSHRRPALARFRREDHLGDPRRDLGECARDLVEERLGRRPGGPVRLLTHLRYGGYVFNPLSVYYCFDAEGRRVEAVVADVTNTPWNERYAYVLAGDGERSAKAFHVSPFMDMDQVYHWTLPEPGRDLVLGIESRRPGGRRLFAAHLSLRRVEIAGPSLARVLVRYPLMTVQVIAGIYWQAWRLRRKGAATFPHPEEARPPLLETTP